MLVRIGILIGIIFLIGGCEPLKNTLGGSPALIVDLNAVAKALGRDEEMEKEMRANEQKLQAQLDKIAENLQAQVTKEKNKLGKKPSKKDTLRFQQFSEQAQQAFRKQQRAAQQKAAQLRDQLVSRFREDVKSVAMPVAQKRGASSIKILGPDMLWYEPEIDITDEVIGQMRASGQKTDTPASEKNQ